MGDNQPQLQAPSHLPKQSKGFAVAALTTGIIAFLIGLVPVLGFIAGGIAIILGIITLVKKQSKGMGITGIVLGALAFITSIAMTAGLAALPGALDDLEEEIAVQVEQDLVDDSGSEDTSDLEEEPIQEEPEPEPAKPEKKERLTLDEGWVTETDDYGMFTTVKGYVSNNSDKPITNYVQITFDTLDAAGANLGTCLANTNTIDANGKWKFEAMCLDDSSEIAQVRFKEISGF